ncbi:MAG TPA: glycosyltransferase [Acidimicrobiales bacterium]|nr:glycosyltransferase [Acidimicrobiales bacterium]
MTSPIRLAIDLQALQVDGYADRGIGRYVSSLSAALGRIGRVAGGLLAPELPPPLGLPAELAEAGLVRWDSMQTLRALMAGNEPVVHHVPAPFLHCGPLDSSSLVVSPHWEDVGLPRVVTLHDLIPLRAPHRYLPTPAHVERYRARATWVAAADLVLADSEFTRREAIELLDCDPDKVVNIGCGVSPYFTPSDGTDGEHFRFFLGDLEEHPFLLTISGSDIRKGTERLIAAVGLLVQAGFDLRLLVVGDLTPPWRARLTDAASSAGMNGRVVLAGSVGDELLRACYRRALVTVMPSVAEGFGLPVLESAACGTPALASATTALAEAAATALATFDPADTGAVSRAIADLLGDEDRRAAVLEAQRELATRSTWEVVAGKAAGAIDAMGATLGRSAWTAPPPPTRLALVGPLPPISGGISVYNDRLLRALARDVAVDAVSPTVTSPELPPGVRHFPIDAFGLDARPSSYDAVVYTLGNSDGHLSTVESALRYPGWIWLHEVRLPAIAVTALDALDDDEFAASLGWLLERSYPGRAPTRAARRAGRSVRDLVTAGVGLLPLLAERCRGVLVNSEVARRLVLLDLPPLAHHAPVRVLPPACPPVTRSDRTGTGRDPVVVALGIVSMAKRPDLLVDAAALVGCRLVFVGPCPPLLAQVIGDRARVRGTLDEVEVTGAVDDAQWRHWLATATVAVQLREGSSGENSAAVLDALSAGVPVITNLATATEFPEGTVSHVPTTDPTVVAARLEDLLAHPEEQRALADGGLRFASDHQFRHLADTLVSIVTD